MAKNNSLNTNTLKVTALTALLLLWLNVQSQKLELGITAGPSVASLYGNKLTEDITNPSPGFVVGPTITLNFNKIVGLHTGLLFERKGAFSKSTVTLFSKTYTTTYYYNFDYLTLPLLVCAQFLPEGGTRLYVNTGPYLGLLLRQSTARSEKTDNSVDKTTAVNTNNFKAFDIGLSAGVGINVPIGSNMGFSFEARNNLGFFNFNEDNTYNTRLKNNSLNFLLGFTIGIK